ncbi:MAG: thioredoxin fold domain-containing protein [Gammaproteobacteria bacterium]|nr:thioredoxin fold domain-containing protein [Gammaproteobacteria bacterium]
MMHSFLNRSLPTLFFSSIIIFSSAFAAPPEGYNFLSLTDAYQQSAAENKPMFLYFGRYGCSTCRKMHKEVFSDVGLTRQFSENFVLAYVDTESGNRIRLPNGERTTEMQFTAQNRILGTPTFVYFDKQQKALFKRSGFQTIKQMLEFNGHVLNEKQASLNLKTIAK